MKKGLILVATIVAVILIGNVVVAYAQNGVTPAQPGTGVCPTGTTCPYSGTMPYGGMHGNMMGGRSQMGGMHEETMTAIAAELDMTYDELTTALQTQTLAQIADAKGVSLEALQRLATAARNAELDKLVAAGTLTQEQADFMQSRMQAMPNFGAGDCPMQHGQSGAQPGAYGRGMMGGRGHMPGVPSGMMGGRGYAQPTGPQG